MTLDEAIKRYTDNAKYERTHGNLQGCLEFRQLVEWLKDYKRLLEQEPCEDAISRQAVLNIVEREQNKGDALSEIEKLPPVNPQPKTGHWINNQNGTYTCDKCGGKHSRSNYCPNCGCRMIEPQESESKE